MTIETPWLRCPKCGASYSSDAWRACPACNDPLTVIRRAVMRARVKWFEHLAKPKRGGK